MSRVHDYLAAYDEQLRSEAETRSAAFITRRGGTPVVVRGLRGKVGMVPPWAGPSLAVSRLEERWPRGLIPRPCCEA